MDMKSDLDELRLSGLKSLRDIHSNSVIRDYMSKHSKESKGALELLEEKKNQNRSLMLQRRRRSRTESHDPHDQDDNDEADGSGNDNVDLDNNGENSNDVKVNNDDNKDYHMLQIDQFLKKFEGALKEERERILLAGNEFQSDGAKDKNADDDDSMGREWKGLDASEKDLREELEVTTETTTIDAASSVSLSCGLLPQAPPLQSHNMLPSLPVEDDDNYDGDEANFILGPHHSRLCGSSMTKKHTAPPPPLRRVPSMSSVSSMSSLSMLSIEDNDDSVNDERALLEERRGRCSVEFLPYFRSSPSPEKLSSCIPDDPEIVLRRIMVDFLNENHLGGNRRRRKR